MCTIYNKTNRQVGYKVIAVKDDKFYSTFTGQEYKIGKVPKCPNNGTRLSDYWSSAVEFDLKSTMFYNRKYAGFSGAFIDKNSAISLLEYIKGLIINDNYNIIIAKVIFKGEVHIGDYCNSEIIAGKEFKSIKPLYNI